MRRSAPHAAPSTSSPHCLPSTLLPAALSRSRFWCCGCSSVLTCRCRRWPCSAAPSSPRRRRRPRPARRPSARPPRATRSTSARTIARWYEAARSARRALELVRAELAHRVEQRGLHARRTRSRGRRRARPGTRTPRVALPREPVDLGAAGVAEAEQPGALVERLAGRVVERRAEHAVAAVRRARRAAACARRSRAGRGTAARAGRGSR